MTALTHRRQMFIQEYPIDFNGTQACIRAGYSPKTANEQAARLLANVSIQNAIQKAMQERSARVKKTADDVFQDIIETTDAARAEGNFNATLKGLEMQCKCLGMFIDKTEISGKDGMPLTAPSLIVTFQGKND